MRSADTSGRTASCTTTISQSASTRSRPRATESCRRGPPFCSVHSSRPRSLARSTRSKRGRSFPATTTTALPTRDAAKAASVWSRTGRPQSGSSGFGAPAPIRFPSPAATITALMGLGPRSNKKAGGTTPGRKKLSLVESGKSMREDMAQLLHDLVLGVRPRDRELFHQKILGGVEHLALAERKLLVALQDEQVAQHLGDLEDRSRLDLFGVLAVAAVPGLLIAFDFFLAEDFVDLGYHVAVDDFSQPDRVDVVDRDHDLHIAVENSEHVKSFFCAGDDLTADRFDLPCAVRGVNHFLADFKHGSLLKRLGHIRRSGHSESRG